MFLCQRHPLSLYAYPELNETRTPTVGQAFVLRRRGNTSPPLNEAEPHDGGDLEAHQNGGWRVPTPTKWLTLKGDK